MTRRLVLVRHAKSDWSTPVSDRDRPLAPRGRRQAPPIGAWLVESGVAPDVVVSSPARRAVDSWAAIAHQLPEPPELLLLEDVYTFDGADLLAALRSLALVSARAECVALIGHNPALEELVYALTGRAARLKTSSIAVVDVDVTQWGDLREGAGRLVTAGRPADGLDPLA